MRCLLHWLSMLLLTLFMASCGDTNQVESENTREFMQRETLNRIRKETGLDLSDESKLIHFFEAERIVDPVWVAKVIIPASSYDDFREVVLRKPTEKTVYHGGLADSISWWKPTSVVLRKQYLADRHTFVIVVLSREGKDYSLYIECAVY